MILRFFGITLLGIVVFICYKAPSKVSRNAPKDHLAPFDFVRACFTFAVVLFHCVVIVNGMASSEKMGADPVWAAFKRSVPFFPHCLPGINAVPIYFMMSGFFTALPLFRCLKANQEINIPHLIVKRYLRLFPLIVIALIYGLLREDQYFYSNEGQPNWTKILGYLLMVGPHLPHSMHWFVDITLLPLWSVPVDFLCSTVLIVFIAAGYKVWGFTVKPVFVLTGLTIVARACVFLQDPACLNLTKLMKVWHPMSNWLGGTTPGIGQFKSTHNVVLSQPVMVTEMEGCNMMNDVVVTHYHEAMYLPSHTRILSFMPGVILAWYYIAAMENPQSKTGSGWCPLIFSFFFLFLSLVAPVDVDNLPPDKVLGNLEIMNFFLVPAAVAFVVYCAIVPPGHSKHSPKLKWIMSLSIFSYPASIGHWIYALHFLLLFELMRWIPTMPISFATGWLYALGICALLTPVSFWCAKHVEGPFLSMGYYLTKTKEGAVAHSDRARLLELAESGAVTPSAS